MKLPENLESRQVSARCGRIHYVAARQPLRNFPPVVLVHGVGLSHRYMLPTAKLMAEEFPLFVPDMPGFGLSVKPQRVLQLSELADALADWMDAVGLPSAALLGNSVGCQVIAELAVRHPERVLLAVLQGPTVDPEARTFPRQMWRWIRNRMGEHSGQKGPIVVRDYWECGVSRLMKTFRFAIEQDLLSLLPQIRCPTVVVRGALDPIVPQQWAEEVTRLLPDGHLRVLPGVPHTANLEAPLELFRVVRPFLLQLGDQQPARPAAHAATNVR